MMFGDMQQLPPIPSTSALFIPPSGKTTVTANEILNIFWGAGEDTLNFSNNSRYNNEQLIHGTAVSCKSVVLDLSQTKCTTF